MLMQIEVSKYYCVFINAQVNSKCTEVPKTRSTLQKITKAS